MTEVDIAIIGAGLSGLLAARHLIQEGLRVAVFERSPVSGGRLATHSIGMGQADSGAQFFTVRSLEFRHHVERWIEDGLVFEWSRGWSDGSLDGYNVDRYPRYAARGGFAKLAEHLARGLPIYNSVQVEAIDARDGQWSISSSMNPLWSRARGILLCLPVPQSLSLLERGGVDPPEQEYLILNSIRYGPCLCGLFDIEGEVMLPEPGALQRPGADISWVADNYRKGISPAAQILTVHAGHVASQMRWEMGDRDILAWMWDEIKGLSAGDAKIKAARLVRWPFAVPLSTYSEPYLLSELMPPLIFAGDAFNGPRVEGAALSGLGAAEAMLRRLA